MNRKSRTAALLNSMRAWVGSENKNCVRPTAKPSVEILEERAAPAIDAFGASGIDAQGLLLVDGGPILDGSGVPIAQVELERPGLAGFDTTASLRHADVVPTAVFLRNGAATANGGQNGREINAGQPFPDGHATGVAGIMISSSANVNNTGVASERSCIRRPQS